MTTTLLIIAIMILLAAVVFMCGLWVGITHELPDEEEAEDSQLAYCFECEGEMPVKEKNGSLYCSNCGLRH